MHLERGSISVVHGTQTLHLKTLNVHVVGVRTASTVSSGTGTSATAKGEFLIVAIGVTTRTSTPETFDGGGFQSQSMLQLNRATYTDDFHAENQADQQSFVTNNSLYSQASPLQATWSSTCQRLRRLGLRATLAPRSWSRTSGTT